MNDVPNIFDCGDWPQGWTLIGPGTRALLGSMVVLVLSTTVGVSGGLVGNGGHVCRVMTFEPPRPSKRLVLADAFQADLEARRRRVAAHGTVNGRIR